MSQGSPMPRSVHANHRSPDDAGATTMCSEACLGADCCEMRSKDSGIRLTYISPLDSAIGADEESRRQTADPVSITRRAVTVEEDGGRDVELGHEGGCRLVAVALVNEQDNKSGMLRGRPFDQRHLAPAGCAIGRPEVDQDWPASEVGKTDARAVESVEGERSRRSAARG